MFGFFWNCYEISFEIVLKSLLKLFSTFLWSCFQIFFAISLWNSLWNSFPISLEISLWNSFEILLKFLLKFFWNSRELRRNFVGFFNFFFNWRFSSFFCYFEWIFFLIWITKCWPPSSPMMDSRFPFNDSLLLW